MARTVHISVVLRGPAAEGLISAWADPRDVRDGIIPQSFVRRIEDALFYAVPTTVSRSQIKRAMKVRVEYLGQP